MTPTNGSPSIVTVPETYPSSGRSPPLHPASNAPPSSSRREANCRERSYIGPCRLFKPRTKLAAPALFSRGAPRYGPATTSTCIVTASPGGESEYVSQELNRSPGGCQTASTETE